MSRLALYLLGPPRIERDGEPVNVRRRKAVALLAYLAVTGERHTRDALATLFWPDSNQSRARAALRAALASLRKALGEDWPHGRHPLDVDRESVGLASPTTLDPEDPEPATDARLEIWVDVTQFHQRLAVSRSHSHPPDQLCAGCLSPLAEAAELYRDDFMTGFTLPDSSAFDEWQFFQGEGLRNVLSSALERLAQGLGAQGEYERAIVYARRWVALDPLHEPAQRLLTRLYAISGQRTAALRQVAECVRVLKEELGAEPEPQTVTFFEQVRMGKLAPPDHPPVPAWGSEIAVPPPAFLEAEEKVVARPVFVARERELARLDRFLGRALAGHGQVVFVTGGPGRGKTALMNEFARRAMAVHGGLLVAMGNCNAYSGLGDPYLPLRDVMAMLTGDVEARWAAGAITREHAQRLWAAMPLAAQALVKHGPHLAGIFFSGPALLSRLSTAIGDSPSWLGQLQAYVERQSASSTSLEQSYLFQQFTNVLHALAQERPLLLIIDDLQWADAASVCLLFHLGRRIADAGTPVLILCAYRPEEVPLGKETERYPLHKMLVEFKRHFGDVWIDLTQIGETEGRQFVDALLDSEPNRVGEPFRRALFNRTAGHALFTVELLRAMQAHGDLVQTDDGAWSEARELNWETMPTRVEAVIEGRVGRLDQELRDMLAIASVEGETFTAQVLAQVQGLSERHVLRTLTQELEAHHRLVHEAGEVRVAGVDRFLSRYRFAHALFQEYLCNGLSPGERRLLHSQVATALETLCDGHTEEIVAHLAHHFAEAGQSAKAIEYALLAGEQARRAHANQEAIEYLQRGLALLKALPLDDPPADWHREMASQLYERLGDVLELTGQHDQARRAYQEALSHVPKMDPAWTSRLHHRLGDTFKSQGRYEESLNDYDLAEDALKLDPENTDPHPSRAWVEIQFSRMLVYYGMGDADKMLALAECTRPVIERHGSLAQRAEFCRLNGQIRARRERYVITDKTLVIIQQALELCQEMKEEGQIATAQFWLGFCFLWRCDLDQAEANLQAALEVADRVGIQEGRILCLSYLSLLCRLRGCREDCRRYTTQCLSASGMEQMPTYTGLAEANLAWLAWRAGNLDQAWQKGQAALQLWQGSVYPFQWTALWPLIGTTLALDRVCDAIDPARALLAPSQQRLPDELAAAVERAIQAWESGQPEAARICLDQAVGLAQAMAYL